MQLSGTKEMCSNDMDTTQTVFECSKTADVSIPIEW